MTPNNYPEGLDELAKVILLKSGIGLYNTAKISGDELSSNFARALLDALAERGYVLVDAKKQEPYSHEYLLFDENGDEVACAYSDALLECPFGRPGEEFSTEFKVEHTPLYTNPAIPGRVALPDGWRDALIFARSVIQPDWENSEGENKPMREWCEMADSLLYAAHTPPTQPQGDGSLRREAE